MKKSLLFGRKRIKDLAGGIAESDSKKDQLLALKLHDLNENAKAAGQLLELPTTSVQSDPDQPRKRFRHLEGLAKSIAEKGIIQPIIVAGKNNEGLYTIIAGERRFRASKMAGLSVIPCIIRSEGDVSTVVLQLLENEQRDNVSPLEESNALARLIDEMGVTKSQLAKELGRDPAWVSIRLGLQKASQSVKSLIEEGVVEDVRTLHELRKLDSESPQAAQQLIGKIRANQVAGSYRDAIADARLKNKAKTSSTRQRLRRITHVEQEGSQLFLYVQGAKNPLQFELNDVALRELSQTCQKSA